MPVVIRPRGTRQMRSALLAAGAAALVAFALPAAAQAACPSTPTTKAFSAFGDTADYSLAPNGDLESGDTGWTLWDAWVRDGNEPFYLSSPQDSQALRISPGGVAMTPPFCVGAEHLTFRFVAREPLGAGSPELHVWIRYLDPNGEVRYREMDQYDGDGDDGGWNPSRSIDLYGRLGFTNPLATTTARLIFGVDDEAGLTWRVDSVFVDPYRK